MVSFIKYLLILFIILNLKFSSKNHVFEFQNKKQEYEVIMDTIIKLYMKPNAPKKNCKPIRFIPYPETIKKSNIDENKFIIDKLKKLKIKSLLISGSPCNNNYYGKAEFLIYQKINANRIEYAMYMYNFCQNHYTDSSTNLPFIKNEVIKIDEKWSYYHSIYYINKDNRNPNE